ncbi:MAG: hypothetical protein AAE986_00125 [Thermoplasmataceae archaeon]|jgi:hypothetical protein
MGKLSGILVGFTVLALMEFFILSSFYVPLEDWLSPHFGPEVYLLFGLLYFLLGNPLNSILLITTQIVVAVSIGIASRKGSRAIGAAISVFSLSWFFIYLTGFYIVSQTGILGSSGSLPFVSLGGIGLPSTSLGSFTSLLSSIPQGTNMASLVNEPIIRRIPYVLPGLESSLFGGGLGASTIESSILPFAIYDIINFVIVVAVAGIVGFLVGRLLRKKRVVTAEEPVTPSVSAASAVTVLVVIVIVFLLLTTMVSPFGINNNGRNGSGASVQLENAIASDPAALAYLPYYAYNSFAGNSQLERQYINASSLGSATQTASFLVSPNGSVYTLLTMMQGDSNTSAISPGGLDGATFAIMMDSSSLVNLLYNPLTKSGSVGIGSFDLKSMLNLMPPELLLIGFDKNVSTTAAGSVAHDVFSAYGISSQILIFTFSGSGSLSIPGLSSSSFFLYGATSPFGASVENYTKNALSSFGNGDAADLLSAEISNGWAVPGSANDTLGSSLFMSGFVDGSEFSTFDNAFPVTVNTTKLGASGIVQFAGMFASNDFKINSHPGKDNLTASMLTGIDKQFTLNSPNPEMMMLIAPGSYPYNFSIPGLGGYFVNIFSNNASLVKSMGLNSSYPGVHVNSSVSVSPDTVLGNISSRVTQAVSLSTSINATSESSVIVNATVWNNGSAPIYNVRVTSPFSTDYSSLIVGTSGSGNHTFASIAAHSSASFIVRYNLTRPGYYYFQPSLLQYIYNNTQYARYSAPASKTVGSESMITAYTEPFDSEVGSFIGPQFETIPGLGIPLLLGLFGLLVLVDIFIEYRALRRWLSRPR